MPEGTCSCEGLPSSTISRDHCSFGRPYPHRFWQRPCHLHKSSSCQIVHFRSVFMIAARKKVLLRAAMICTRIITCASCASPSSHYALSICWIINDFAAKTDQEAFPGPCEDHPRVLVWRHLYSLVSLAGLIGPPIRLSESQFVAPNQILVRRLLHLRKSVASRGILPCAVWCAPKWARSANSCREYIGSTFRSLKEMLHCGFIANRWTFL